MRRCESAAALVANTGTAAAVLRHTPQRPQWALATALKRRYTTVMAGEGCSRDSGLPQTIHFQNPAGVGSQLSQAAADDGNIYKQIFREGSIGAIAAKECLRLQKSYRRADLRVTTREAMERMRSVRDPSFSKQQIRRYRQDLQRYKRLREELATWSNAFYARHGVRPAMADVQATGIEWLITRFREYVVVREKVLLETMVIRKQLELNPNAELSAAAQEAVNHAPAVHLDPESGRAQLVLNPQPLSPRKSAGRSSRRSRNTSTVPAASKNRLSESETSDPSSESSIQLP